MPDRDPITPDTKDWTWVMTRPCPDCGYDASAVSRGGIAECIRADAARWVDRLNRPDVAVRPRPDVWSTLEYGCHVRDVHRIFNERVNRMLHEDDPRFPNWDQDATAIADDYGSQDPSVVASELLEAAATMAETYSGITVDAWSRRGLRSNGSEFTIASISLYHLHDIVHHAHDVDHG